MYRQVGRVTDAQAVEAELRQVLAVADPDHPMRVRLQQREEAGVESSNVRAAASPASGPVLRRILAGREATSVQALSSAGRFAAATDGDGLVLRR